MLGARLAVGPAESTLELDIPDQPCRALLAAVLTWVVAGAVAAFRTQQRLLEKAAGRDAGTAA